MLKLASRAIVAVGLAATLCAVPAYAADLSAGQLAEGESGTVTEAPAAEAPAPENAKVYVLSKIGDMECTYNSKGLLAQRKNASTTITFKYSGSNIKSYTSKFEHGRSKSTTTGKLTYDKKGRPAKLVEKNANGSATDTYTYNKAGNVKKYTHQASGQGMITYKCAYDADGRMIKRNASGGDKTKTSYEYDENGNMKSATFQYGSRGYTFEYANTYKKGRMTKKTTKITSLGSYSTTASYSYKKITVPAKYAQAVADQQWALLNPQVSFSYPLSY